MLMVLPWFPACGHQVRVKKTDETEWEDSKLTEEDIEALSRGLSTHLHSSTFHEVLSVIFCLAEMNFCCWCWLGVCTIPIMA